MSSKEGNGGPESLTAAAVGCMWSPHGAVKFSANELLLVGTGELDSDEGLSWGDASRELVLSDSA